jgi:predicted AAA+ superfamily ATPase
VIKGTRGVGKTTLLQQYIKEKCPPDKSIWISLDHILFHTTRIISVIDELYDQGIRIFVLDEVHKYPDWSIEVKNIYDSYPDAQLLITSSSALDIMSGMADLSRRADVYHMEGLSFREYLLLDLGIKLPKYSFEEILANHIPISEELTNAHDIHKHFNSFLKIGYYPFFKESKKRYPERVKTIINQVIEVDLPPIFSIDYNSIRQLKKLLALLARLVPYSPDISQLSRDVGIGRNRILLFLDYLNSAGLIHLLKSAKKSDSVMAKPDKIFLNNTNLIYALGMGITNAGTIRETYIMNALSATEQISTPIKGDFMINNTHIAEVGGKSKNFKQISGLPNSFLIKEDILVGSQDVIPMWIFGLLY